MILLDTHTVIKLVLRPEALWKEARKVILRAERSNGVAIASITLWEIALLIAQERIRVRGTTEEFLKWIVQRPGLCVLDLTPAIAALAYQLPEGFPGDPADRLIAATARAHGLTLVTRDQRLLGCPMLQTIW
jgi:PIN domain nuclease of toxin-antitoxin system